MYPRFHFEKICEREKVKPEILFDKSKGNLHRQIKAGVRQRTLLFQRIYWLILRTKHTAWRFCGCRTCPKATTSLVRASPYIRRPKSPTSVNKCHFIDKISCLMAKFKQVPLLHFLIIILSTSLYVHLPVQVYVCTSFSPKQNMNMIIFSEILIIASKPYNHKSWDLK